LELLENGKVRNLFIFGEDPAGTAVEPAQPLSWIEKADFTVVQEYFMSETAKQADLILPATLPFETGGSFTNSQKYIQQFSKETEGPVENAGFQQIAALLKALGVEAHYETPADVMLEAASILQKMPVRSHPRDLHYTTSDNENRMFENGCDYLQTRAFDDLQ
jgi:formate dehydrogenase major subunit